MRNTARVRAGVSMAVAVVALAGGAQAFGAIVPKLTVTSTEATNRTVVTYEQGAADDALFRVSIFAPTSVFMPAAQVQGDRVGTATYVGANGKVTGVILADATPTPGFAGATTIVSNGVRTALPTLWRNCVGTPQPGPANTSNYWEITTKDENQTIPIFFSSINQDEAYGDVFLAVMHVCFPAAWKVTSLTLNLERSVSTSPGISIWHAAAYPYVNNAASASGFEAEAQDRLPWDVSMTAKKGKGSSVSVSGRVTAGEKPTADASVKIKAGKGIKATVKAGKDGRFTATFNTKQTELVAHATAPGVSLGACTEPKFAPFPCSTATLGPLDASSDPVTIK